MTHEARMAAFCRKIWAVVMGFLLWQGLGLYLFR